MARGSTQDQKKEKRSDADKKTGATEAKKKQDKKDKTAKDKKAKKNTEAKQSDNMSSPAVDLSAKSHKAKLDVAMNALYNATGNKNHQPYVPSDQRDKSVQPTKRTLAALEKVSRYNAALKAFLPGR